MSPQPQETQFEVGHLVIAAKAWHDPSLFPVIALHGWLDNAASFDVLAPKLKHCHVLALDLAGHGRSGHRTNLAPYNIWEDIAEIMAIADQLGWHKFGLLGHSRGAAIATLTTGAFPARVQWLGLIDGLLPEPADPADAPEQLARSIQSVTKQLSKDATVYATLEEAILARQTGMTELSYQAAKRLAERGTKPCEGGFCWSSDQKLRGASALRLTEAHITAFLHRIKLPTTLILADKGMRNWFKRLTELLHDYPLIQPVHVSASHHLHMEQHAAEIADIFNAQLEKVAADISTTDAATQQENQSEVIVKGHYFTR